MSFYMISFRLLRAFVFLRVTLWFGGEFFSLVIFGDEQGVFLWIYISAVSRYANGLFSILSFSFLLYFHCTLFLPFVYLISISVFNQIMQSRRRRVFFF